MGIKITRNSLKRLILYLLLFALLVSTPALFLQNHLSINNIKSFVSSFGAVSPIIFIIFIASTNVIPPLAVTPFWIASIFLFGPILGFSYSFIGNLVGSSCNFYIARIWGRPAVLKLAGKTALDKIDKLPNISNPIAVFLLKLFGGAATDYISYASGLSKIYYIPYLIASGVSVLPMMIVGFYLVTKVSLDNPVSAASALGIFYTINYTLTLALVPLSAYLLKTKLVVGFPDKSSN